MLKPAILYKDELNKIIPAICYDPYYKWLTWTRSNIILEWKFDTDNWKCIQLVSISNEEILGVVELYRSEPEHIISNILAISLRKNDILYIKDLKEAVENCFTEFNFHKIKASCIEGNPANVSFSKLIKSLGGRRVCTFKKDIKLMDDKLYDVNWYEVTEEEYMESKHKIKGD